MAGAGVTRAQDRTHLPLRYCNDKLSQMKKTQYKGGGEGVKGGLHCDLFLRNMKNVKIENGLNPGVTYFNGI